jgi:hypothetical protein
MFLLPQKILKNYFYLVVVNQALNILVKLFIIITYLLDIRHSCGKMFEVMAKKTSEQIFSHNSNKTDWPYLLK